MTFLFREQLPLDEAMHQAVAWNDIHNLIPSPEEEIIEDKFIRTRTVVALNAGDNSGLSTLGDFGESNRRFGF